jgi:hypothetical protein
VNPYAPKRLAVALVGALAPLIMALSVFIANEAQTLFNMHLSGIALAGYLSTFLIAVGAVLFRLLEHEASRFLHGLAKLLLETPEKPAPPTQPPTAVMPEQDRSITPPPGAQA